MYFFYNYQPVGKLTGVKVKILCQVMYIFITGYPPASKDVHLHVHKMVKTHFGPALHTLYMYG